ncbi:hypothetical protein [uncultured Azohydromonas sp.]|jgi:hypothetical protein|uniref:hypothetical protein n=1 Tax=uncultured Azohydromonas sp. TaxID=487342 RepID=UPI00262860CA|nr:hypothetical protein [uncultured Azohydromonas sp.]
MRKSILEIYALTVCFFAVVCFVFVSALAIHDVVQIMSPQFTLDRHQYERYLSNDSYIRAAHQGSAQAEAALRALPREELTRLRVSELKRTLRVERHEGQLNLFKMLIVLVVDAVAFAIHWKIGHVARCEMA